MTPRTEIGGLSDEQVVEYTEALSRHYNEPVRPVSHYCNAFRSWARALHDQKHEFDPNLAAVTEHALSLEIAIVKSNLLYRLIYAGQPLRTEKCPTHKGHWSGCEWDSFCECMDGSDVTGWLPNHRLDMYELIQRWLKANGHEMAHAATHFPASADYDADEPTTISALGRSCRGKTLDEAAKRLAERLAGDGFVPEEWQPVEVRDVA